MSTLAEIENTVAALPRREQEALLRHLAARLHSPLARRATRGGKKSWPVAPPKVNRMESQRIMQRIEIIERGCDRTESRLQGHKLSSSALWFRLAQHMRNVRRMCRVSVNHSSQVIRFQAQANCQSKQVNSFLSMDAKQVRTENTPGVFLDYYFEGRVF